jgi:regulator of protease activity HflC (stomatin/prohibitin superfamily)
VFEGLLNFLIQVREWLVPWTIVQCYERGVLLRFGKFEKDLDPGFHWCIPFGVDNAITETTVPNSCHTNTQTLLTHDNKRVNVSMCVIYTIKDTRKFLLEVEGRGAFVSDCVITAVSKHVRNTALDDLFSDKSCTALYKAARAKAFQYGVELQSLDFADCAPGTGLRLFNTSE